MNICVTRLSRKLPTNARAFQRPDRGSANGNKPPALMLVLVNCKSSRLSDLKPFLVHLVVCYRFDLHRLKGTRSDVQGHMA